MMRSRAPYAWALLVCAACGPEPEAGRTAADVQTDAAGVADELLATDRGYAAAASGTDLVSALTAMFAPDVTMPTPEAAFASGLPEATAALDADPLNRRSRIEWAPVRVGVSADGLHGFTFGYMTVHRPDSTRVPGKYLTYWVKGDGGWKAAAYKRGQRAEGEPDTTPMAPALPAEIVAPSSDEATLEEHRSSLAAAERAFSDEAQVIGLGPAFAKHGREDAVNMGGPDALSWVVGAQAIGAAVGGGQEGPSPVTWDADRALVASSGDLGVTFGFIVPSAPPSAEPTRGFPFFTVWRRSGPGDVWRYVAE